MTALDALKDIQSFLRETIREEGIQLFREESEELVAPYVELCYLPHHNFAPAAFQCPGVLVAMDQLTDEADQSLVEVRLVCCTYGGGFYPDSQIPDAQGYRDLITLMERLKIALAAQNTLGQCSLRRPITTGIYDGELCWPYWYGYLTFSVDIPTSQFIMKG